jgi:hypothetical protein
MATLFRLWRDMSEACELLHRELIRLPRLGRGFDARRSLLSLIDRFWRDMASSGTKPSGCCRASWRSRCTASSVALSAGAGRPNWRAESERLHRAGRGPGRSGQRRDRLLGALCRRRARGSRSASRCRPSEVPPRRLATRRSPACRIGSARLRSRRASDVLAFENGLGGVALRQVCGWEF